MTGNVIFHVKSLVTKHVFWGSLILKSQHLMQPNLTWNKTWNETWNDTPFKKLDDLLVNSSIQFIFKTACKCNNNNSNAPSKSKIGRMTHHSIFLYHISQNGIHKHGFQHKKGKNNLEFVKGWVAYHTNIWFQKNWDNL